MADPLNAIPCPACGFDSPPGLRFCGNCGAPLAPAAPTEERRLVTVLFADVTGSTALGETLDPEDLRALLARYYAIAQEAVHAHGGTVAKFIGDAVMAIFGLPQAHGDDARRALSAALDLRDRVRGDPRLGERLPIRLGVNSGEVVATRDPAAGEFLITGDAVNVAARLEQAAEPWAILCGERTASAAGDAFAFGPPAAVDARGKSAPIPARLLLGRVTDGVARRIPLVGRRSDLAQLELVARRAFGESRPFLVSLIAPAGTGKSRLLEEFLARLPALAPGAREAVAQCLPYGQRLTYWPLRAVLYALAGISEEDPPEAARAAVRAWVLETGGVESPERTADLLAATVGLGETEAVDRAALFAAWRAAVESAARRVPLVLAFEDLHWSSDSLLDLVEFVMQPRGDSAVLMIALARPELLDRRPAWGGGRRNYVSLALEPLADGEMAELVEHLLGTRSPEIVGRVVARAEGNPFYAGEIVRSVVERVPSLQDRQAVERALAALPDTVQATVLARIDLLEAEERRVLQLGSVFGRAFRLAGIAAVAPGLAAQTGQLAERLAAKDLVRPTDTDAFAFRHILIREVAYQTLPRAERARLHAAAGCWLEEHAGGREDERAELIAYHYREAAMLAGTLEDDARVREIRGKAVHWLARAAEVAAAGAALGEAVRHLQAAIELAEGDRLAELYERLGNVGSGNASAKAYRTALRLCREAGGPPDQELRVLASLLMLYTRFLGSVSARLSVEELERLRAAGRALVPRVRDRRAVASFLIAEAFVPFWHAHVRPATAAELADAESCALRGLEIAEGLDDVRLRSAALDGLGSIAQARGSWEESRQFARRRMEFEDRLDLPERMDAYSVVAWDSAVLGDLEEADRISATGLALLQPGQAVGMALHLAAWRTYVLTLLGNWDEVSAVAERAHQLWVESGNKAAGYATRGFMAALDVARGRQDARLAERCRETLGAILENFDPDSTYGRIRFYVASDLDALEERVLREFRSFFHSEYLERGLSLCSDQGRPPAPEVVRPIAEFAAANGFRILEAQCLRALGAALPDPAELARALELFEQTGAVPYAARVRCELGLLTGDEARLAAGLQELEAIGDLEQLARFERARTGAEKSVRGGP